MEPLAQSLQGTYTEALQQIQQTLATFPAQLTFRETGVVESVRPASPE